MLSILLVRLPKVHYFIFMALVEHLLSKSYILDQYWNFISNCHKETPDLERGKQSDWKHILMKITFLFLSTHFIALNPASTWIELNYLYLCLAYFKATILSVMHSVLSWSPLMNAILQEVLLSLATQHIKYKVNYEMLKTTMLCSIFNMELLLLMNFQINCYFILKYIVIYFENMSSK